MRSAETYANKKRCLLVILSVLVTVILLTSSGCSKDFIGGFGIDLPWLKPDLKFVSGFLSIATDKDVYNSGERILLTPASEDWRDPAKYEDPSEAQLIKACRNLRIVLSTEAEGGEECRDVRIELNGKDITSFCSPQPLTIHSAYNEITCNPEETETSGFGKVYACGSEASFVYGSGPDPNRLDYVPGELLVKLKPSVEIEVRKTASGQSALSSNDAHLQALLHKYKATDVEDVFEGLFIAANGKADMPDDLKGIKKITIDVDKSVTDAVREFNTLSEIEYAEPNYLAYAAYVPNDLSYEDQWSHIRTQAEIAWDIEQGNPNEVIAIIDSGVAYNHIDLKENMLADCTGGCPEGTGYDFVDIHTFIYRLIGFKLDSGEDHINPDNDPVDYQGHGTKIAGIAAATGDNTVGVVGVCPKCRIIPVRVMFAASGTFFGHRISLISQVDDLAKGIVHSVNNDADVLSLSTGVFIDLHTIKRAIKYAFKQGAVIVDAAGNDNCNRRNYPAAYDHVIAVAATNNVDRKTEFSNYGSWIDVAAPGEDVKSTIVEEGGVSESSQYESGLNGTSFAAPYISGTAALILSHYPGLGNVEVMRMIREGVDEIPDKSIGTGRINVYKALRVRPESKVMNTGDLDIEGFLNIWIERYAGDAPAYNPDGRQDHGVKSSEWRTYYSVVKKEPVKIKKGATLSLDQYFNPKKISLTEPGRYRVFAEVTDKREVTIATVSRPLAWSWEFWVE